MIGCSEQVLKVDIVEHVRELRSKISVSLGLFSIAKLTLLALFNHSILPFIARSGCKPINLRSLSTLLL